eukprot:CAMPEP_0117538612 /NCGR_PEP_ID=MMETSP0784-20121206/42567_1 /TAXON_ID=39447 /ORGANISM="" /LENGTH=398 /DNA_ID=CAMNT_0005335229 /DNA_START=78 /DNA_END=1274 /DNA_ORIENTATION=-
MANLAMSAISMASTQAFRPEADNEGDTLKLLSSDAVAQAPINSVLALQAGEKEEAWEFEFDTFTVGVESLLRHGCRTALPSLGLATLTVGLQVCVFLKVYAFLQTYTRAFNEDLLAVAVCFILAMLQISNESCEGFYKLVFGLRGLTGMYADLHPLSFVAPVAFGFLQFSIALSTMGLSMQLVAHSETTLDAFLNFVALSFIVEIDNVLMESRVMKTIACSTEVAIRVRHSTKASTTNAGGVVPMTSLVALNVIVMLVIPLDVACTSVAAESQGVPLPLSHWFAEVPAVLVTLATLNLTFYVGSRFYGAVSFAFKFTPLLLAMYVGRLTYYWLRGDAPPCSVAVTLLCGFSFFSPAVATASEQDPFPVLRCPIKVPLLSIASLVVGVLWIEALHEKET